MNIAIFLIFATFVAPQVVGKEKTLMDTGYGNHFNKSFDKIFKKLDQDKNGLISQAELNDGFRLAFKTYVPSNATMDTLMTADSNHDGSLSYDELNTKMTDILSTNVTVDANICDKVKKGMDSCTHSVNPFRNVTSTFDKSDAKTIYNSCISGLSSLNNFPTETCIMEVEQGSSYKQGSSVSCSEVKRCVNSYFHRNATESISKDMAFVNSNVKIWSIILFSGLFALVLFTFLFSLVATLGATIVAITLGLGFLIAAFVAIGIEVAGAIGYGGWNVKKDKLLPEYQNILDHNDPDQEYGLGTNSTN